MRPQIKEFEDLQFKMPRLVDAGRGIPLYIYDGSVQDVSRIDLIFRTGAYEQSAPLVAQAAAEASTEASEKKSFGVVSELIDFYGGWVRKTVSLHYTIFTLYSPNRTYNKFLPLFFEVLTTPRFSKKDLERFKRQGRESLKVNQKKVESISSTIFKTKMFGTHPYGITPTVEDYDALCIDSIREYANERFVAEKCQVVLSGDVDSTMITLLEENLQRLNTCPNIQETKCDITEVPPRGLVVEEVKNALQSSVRIGARTINRSDENYMNLHLLNSALGGYFGSRLNKNIREDKGYTYGINSWLIGLPDAAYFTISSHTAIHYTAPLIEEVKNERLRRSCVEMLKLLPDYFYKVEASSSGKYHPAFALGEGGLVRHTKVAAQMANEIISTESVGNVFTSDEKDLIIISLLLHDGLKKGLVEERYTRFDHPILMGDYVLENIDKTEFTNAEAKMVSDNIKSHMGEWNTNQYSTVILPKPKNKYQKMVHMCDLLASRKFIDVHFENNNIVK